jgi:hypothetical protein
VTKVTLESKVTGESRVLLAQQAQLVQQVLKVQPEPLVRKAKQALKVLEESKAFRDQRET